MSVMADWIVEATHGAVYITVSVLNADSRDEAIEWFDSELSDAGIVLSNDFVLNVWEDN